MSKPSGRPKHIPQRTCVACRTVRPKRALIRIVRTPEGEVRVDERGKQSGRGAYLCAQRVCWEEALKRRRLDAALKVTLDDATMAALRQYAEQLPERLEE
ncbi:MAG: YlxR family protein [Anaerolineae bacterium]|nr:YlxR family protein [Anaerolineae bacterium]MCX8067425.1 YlxR family protein [Anaerolineae bacterium]MDW7991157.1 YlxR family protein [Anaerolineae bacterium]